MTPQGRIRGTQLLWLLLAGRLSSCLLLPADSLHALTVPDLIAVTALNALVLLLLALPTLLVLRRGDGNLADRGGRLVVVGYLLVSLFVLYLDILQFRDFAGETTKADFSVTLLTASLIVVGFAASLYGLEALGRTAAVVAVIGMALLLVFGALLIPRTESINFPPAVFSGWPTVLSQTVKELPRTAEIVAVGALYPYVNGKVGRSFVGFVGLTAALTLFVCIVTTGVLGDFAGLTAYPFYTAVTAASAGVIERLDIFVVALWLGTFFVRVALFGVICLDHARRLFGDRSRLPVAGVGAVLLMALTVLTQYIDGQWRTVTYVYWGVLALFGIGLPLWVYRRKRL
ncbi:MAG: GerAB/ArcD/ProY family transporter [Clostridia bacterium]|nr:GerAB/ArcD/ProY family transporter [Clostridia bacterium]